MHNIYMYTYFTTLGLEKMLGEEEEEETDEDEAEG